MTRQSNRTKVTPATDAGDAPAQVDLGYLAGLLGYRLRRAQLAVFQDFITSMRDYDLRPAQFSVLAIIRANPGRSEEHTSELQSLMRISYAVFCLKQKKIIIHQKQTNV